MYGRIHTKNSNSFITFFWIAPRAEGPSCGLEMEGMMGWLVGSERPDPSLTRFSDIKTFNKLFLSKVGTQVAGTRY